MKNFFLASMILLGAMCPSGPKCPLHETMMGTLDHFEYPDGKQVGIYRCPRGPHKFTVVC